jgi:hypothetical protein
MARRAVAALVILSVALADATGDHRVAFYALVLAIPPLAIATMDSFGDYLEGGSGFRALTWAVALGLAVASSAVRGQVPGEATVPAVAVSAFFVCLALVWAQAVVDVGRLALERQRPRGTLHPVD